MGTATQLVPAFVDAEPLEWDRGYTKNMRPLRQFPNYWRLTDYVDYVDGPVGVLESFTDSQNIWKCEIVLDEDFNRTSQVIAYNTKDNVTFEGTSEGASGEVLYTFEYEQLPPEVDFNHTNAVDAVSIEFDQLGRPLIFFESNGSLYLRWFNPVEGATVVDLIVAGRTPVVTTDTYNRQAGPAESERLLFYVKSSDDQLYYRKQLDRYEVEYPVLTEALGVDELLEVSKNIYGGITAVYTVSPNGTDVEIKTATALQSADVLNLGTDKNVLDTASLLPSNGFITDFELKLAAFTKLASEQTSLIPSSSTFVEFEIKDSRVSLLAEENNATLEAGTGSILSFDIEFVPPPQVVIVPEPETASLSPTASSGFIQNFELKEALIFLQTEPESGTLSPGTGQITTFTVS